MISGGTPDEILTRQRTLPYHLGGACHPLFSLTALCCQVANGQMSIAAFIGNR